MGLLELTNPATGEVRGVLAEYTEAEVQAAMAKAREAFVRWGQTSLAERLAYVRKLRLYLADHADELAKEIAFDTGKVFMDALAADVYTTVDAIRYFEKNAGKILAPQRRKSGPVFIGKKVYVTYRPIGAVAVISPWNYPFQLSMIPAISALVSGNTVLLKPSEVTPLTGLLMERAFRAAELPDGVVQVLHGGRETGQALVAAKPDTIFFTGSVPTGKKIAAAAAEHLIPVVLELGGKDPMIVLDDADLELAAEAAVWGGFTNCGQVCMSVERVYVHEQVYDRFERLVAEKTAAIRQGSGETDDVGSMTFARQREIVRDHLEDAQEKGARVLTGGQIDPHSMFVPPTVLVDADHRMKIVMEETFGPVLPIMRVRSDEEAVRLANDSAYGLNASVWSGDPARARRIASRLVTGNVCINDVIVNVAIPDLPFGGVKDSGIGRYHGPEGLRAFCRQTSVLESRSSFLSLLTWYPYSKEKIELVRWLIKLHGNRKKWFDLQAAGALWRLLTNRKPDLFRNRGTAESQRDMKG
jgi:acyl-CoA reductase-like NAD-dependent aldehyde dehydrogenase